MPSHVFTAAHDRKFGAMADYRVFAITVPCLLLMTFAAAGQERGGSPRTRESRDSSRRLFSLLDTNEDGQLQESEADERYREAFAKADLDKNRVLDREELRNFMAAIEGAGRSRDTSRERSSRPPREPSADSRDERTAFRSEDLERFLDEHPRVANSLVWYFDGEPRRYVAWPGDAKSTLHALFDGTRRERYPRVPDPPEPAVQPSGSIVTISKTDGARLYFSTIAHCLAVEVDEKVRWSIVDYPDELLRVLLSGESMFRPQREEGPEYRFMCVMHITPSPPQVPYNFLGEGRFIKSTRLDTIVALLGWSQHHLSHSGGSLEGTAFMDDHWQYPGPPPLSRVLSGTVKKSSGRRGHWIDGCYGNTAFLQAVLRTVNIPVTAHYPGGHTTAGFPTEAKYLSHGDDPYTYAARYWRADGEPCPYDPRDLLIDQKTYDQWFGEDVPPEEQGRNVGRRPAELTAEILPPFVVREFIDDLKHRRPPQDSRVYSLFEGSFTLDELNRMKLWRRLAVKARNFQPPPQPSRRRR